MKAHNIAHKTCKGISVTGKNYQASKYQHSNHTYCSLEEIESTANDKYQHSNKYNIVV